MKKVPLLCTVLNKSKFRYGIMIKSNTIQLILEGDKDQPKYAEAAPNNDDELKKWEELKDEGIITEEEFQAKKEQLL